MNTSRLLLVFLFVISISFLSKGEEKKYKKILGVWEFSAPNAPAPYNGGILTITEVEKKLTGEFNIQGQAMQIPQIEFEENALTLGFEVENTPITLILKLKDGILEGTTDTPNGTVTVTAKPAKKEAK
jgi:hypothetical protein